MNPTQETTTYVDVHYKKNISPYGQESPGWISLFKLVTFSLFLKIYRNIIFLVKSIGQWIPDGDGRGIARDILKKIFLFSKLNKNW